jgi:rhodanese-related sulfurtransferase
MSQFPTVIRLINALREAWKRGVNLATGVRDIGPNQAMELIGGGAFVLDVREPEEWARGVVAGSILLRLSDLEERKAEIAPLRHQTLIVVCHGGKRSATACRTLARLGFALQLNLAGGILAWQSAGHAVERFRQAGSGRAAQPQTTERPV